MCIRDSGETWWDGDTLQAAIGQSDNLLTPLQLANYVATIVNGGTRYQPTLLRSVRSYVGNEEIKAFEPTVVEELGKMCIRDRFGGTGWQKFSWDAVFQPKGGESAIPALADGERLIVRVRRDGVREHPDAGDSVCLLYTSRCV